MSLSSMYFVRIRGKIMGPFGEAQLIALRDRGQLKPFHEVSPDRVLWNQAATLTWLFQPIVPSEIVNNPQPIVGGPNQGGGPPGNEAWFISDEKGNRQGPMDYAALRSCVDSDQITGETMVWKAGMSEWVRASLIHPGLFGPKSSKRKGASFGEPNRNKNLVEDLKKTRLGILLILIGGLVAIVCFPLDPIAFVLAVIGLGFCMSSPSPAKGPATLTFYFCIATGLLWIVWFVSSIFGGNILLDFVAGIYSGGLFEGAKENQIANQVVGAASLTFLGFLVLTFMVAIGLLFTCGGFLQHTLRNLAVVTGESAIIKLANINFIIYCVLSGLLVTLVYLLVIIPLLFINGIFIFSPTLMPKIISTILIIESLLFLCISVCYIVTLVVVMQLYGKFGKMISDDGESGF